jgi:4-hydroxybenzoate polyprenyltransferase
LNHYSPLEPIIFTIITVCCFTAGGNVLNDIWDVKADVVNQPQRPIPSGQISLSEAIGLMLMCFSLGIGSVLMLSFESKIFALGIVLPLLILYTPILKRIPLIGNLAIASLLGMVFIFTELALTHTVEIMIIPALLAFGLTLIRELVKDISDIEGDIQINAQTFPIVFGIKPSIFMVSFFIVLLTIFSILPFLNNLYGISYLIGLILTVEIPLFYCIFFLWNNPTSTACAVVSKWMKWITIAGIGVILLSKF